MNRYTLVPITDLEEGMEITTGQIVEAVVPQGKKYTVLFACGWRIPGVHGNSQLRVVN